MITKTGSFERLRRRACATSVLRPVPTVALALIMVLAAGFPSEVTGQSAPVPGVHIRVHRNDSDTTVEGSLVSMDGEGLVYRQAKGDDVRINRESVDSVEFRVWHRHGWRGLGIGAVGGALIGGIIASATYTPCESCMVEVLDRGGTTAAGALAGVLVGGLVGVIVGSSIKTESWKPVVGPWAGELKGLPLGVQITLGHRLRRSHPRLSGA
jgi:hypothetical protein